MPVVHLLPLMLERVGLLLIIVFLLSRMKSFRQIIRHEHRLKDKLLLIAIFGVFGIVSNYTGIKISGGLVATEPWQTAVDADSAIANTRVLGVALGGLLGGRSSASAPASSPACTGCRSAASPLMPAASPRSSPASSPACSGRGCGAPASA